MPPYFKRLINHTEFVFLLLLRKYKCTKFYVRSRGRAIENTVCTV